jgi:isocitrate/isopropylmalate dehydrogenase
LESSTDGSLTAVPVDGTAAAVVAGGTVAAAGATDGAGGGDGPSGTDGQVAGDAAGVDETASPDPPATGRREITTAVLTLVHKCNVLTHCGDLWVRVHKEMGDAHYPEIKQDYNHVDACTMWFVKQPEYYDVIVTENLFGDIITDLAAIIQGGLGIAAGGNINPEGVSMFEPMGGSAPKYTGKNVINPLATICAGGMMMDTLGEPKNAQAIDKAVHQALDSKQIKSLAAGKMGMGTREVGDLIAKMVS